MNNLEKAKLSLGSLNSHEELLEKKIDDLNIDRVSEVFEFKRVIEAKRKHQKTIEKLSDDYSHLYSKVEGLSKINRKLKKEYSSLDHDYIRITARVENLSKINNEMSDKIKSKEHEVQKLQENKRKGEERLSLYHDSVLAREQRINKLNDEADTLKETIKSLKIRIGDLKIAKESKVQSIEDYERDIVEFKASLESKTQYYRELEETYKKIKSGFDSIQADSENLIAKRDKIIDAIGTTNDAVNISQSKLDKAVKTNKDLQKEISSLNEMEMLSQMTISHVEKEYLAAKRKSEKLEREIDEKKGELKKLSEDLKYQNQALDKERNSCSGKSFTIQTLMDLISKTREQLAVNKETLMKMRDINEVNIKGRKPLPRL